MNRDFIPFLGNTKKSNIYVIRSQKERGKSAVLEKKMSRNFPNLLENIKLTDSRSRVTSKHNKPKEIHAQLFHNQTTKN